eukprot:TRINITY_DN14468_c0_g1_i1.p2 TRINITY_DN14468_c0_g1~~TRINITY_DN14468_c0_g1_i1.p2  ORF type:complete len:162 (-),score=34.54 TRINITY_DN14468_c0_g1_i1:336-821(-)
MCIRDRYQRRVRGAASLPLRHRHTGMGQCGGSKEQKGPRKGEPVKEDKRAKWKNKLEESKARHREERENREENRVSAQQEDPARKELFGEGGNNKDAGTKGGGNDIGAAMAKNKSMLGKNVDSLANRVGSLNEQADRSGEALNQGSKFAAASRKIRERSGA